MDIIMADELASYLRVAQDDAMDLIVELANGLVSETLGDPDEDTYVVPSIVRTIVFEVAGRAYRNPEGLASESIDDYKYSRAGDTRQAGVYLTADEEARLLRSVGTPRAKSGWLA